MNAYVYTRCCVGVRVGRDDVALSALPSEGEIFVPDWALAPLMPVATALTTGTTNRVELSHTTADMIRWLCQGVPRIAN